MRATREEDEDTVADMEKAKEKTITTEEVVVLNLKMSVQWTKTKKKWKMNIWKELLLSIWESIETMISKMKLISRRSEDNSKEIDRETSLKKIKLKNIRRHNTGNKQ